MGVVTEITLRDCLIYEAELADIAELPKKRAKPVNLNPHTRKRLIEQGYVPVLTEHYDMRTRRKHDLFGFCDFLGLGERDVLAVQVTSKANMSARIKKIASDELADIVAAVRKAGIRIEVWGFFKLANGRWDCKVVDCS